MLTKVSPSPEVDTDLLTILEISYYIGYSVYHPIIADVTFLLTTQELPRHKLDMCF